MIIQKKKWQGNEICEITCLLVLKQLLTKFRNFSCVSIVTVTVKLLPRPVRTAPPSKNPATSHSLRSQLASPSRHFFWSTDWTHHLTLREWDLYWVKRKTSSSFEFTLSRSYFSNCRDSCYCRCSGQKATKSHWPMTSKQLTTVSDARNQFSSMKWWIWRLGDSDQGYFNRGVRKISVRKVGAVAHGSNLAQVGQTVRNVWNITDL